MHNKEATERFGKNISNHLSGAAAEFGDACSYVSSPEEAQEIYVFFSRQLQEFINEMARLL